jgi:hypothetical protein
MKNVLFICVSICLFGQLAAQIQGPYSGASFSTSPLDGSDQSWMNSGNAATSDDVYASFNDLPDVVGSHTDYLVATSFGFTIPSNAVISGVIVEIERSDANSKTADYSIKLLKSGTIGGNDKATGLLYPSTDTYQSYGGSNDKWGNSLTPADINSSGFGVAVAAKRAYAGILGGPTLGKIDHIRITVYYNFFTLPVTLIDFSLTKKIGSVQLNWNTTDEINMDHFEIERSANGRDFFYLASIACRNLPALNSYVSEDNGPLKGVSYYRLKMISHNGDIKYSKIISVQYNNTDLVSLYPTIWQKGVPLNVTNPNNENLTILFFNESGQVISKASTNSGTINNSPSQFKGLTIYSVYNQRNELLGLGKLFIQ